ncbi:MAG TPA: hypothetical protein VH482_21370 [Thermomicrobiales bacterium]
MALPVFRSGLDWSGDAGDPAKPGSQAYLVFAVAHIAEGDLGRLDAALRDVRRARGLPGNYPFKYKKARPDIRQTFFAALGDIPCLAHILIVDKRLWTPSYLRSTRGTDRINHAMVELIRGCSHEFIGGQVLLIDGARDELPTLRMARQALSRAMSERGGNAFKKVRMCSDEDPDGSILQVADMIAGVLRDQGLNSPLLDRLRDRLTLV